jgi:hypothetical protein
VRRLFRLGLRRTDSEFRLAGTKPRNGHERPLRHNNTSSERTVRNRHLMPVEQQQLGRLQLADVIQRPTDAEQLLLALHGKPPIPQSRSVDFRPGSTPREFPTLLLKTIAH